MSNKPVKYTGRYKLKFRGTECLNCGHPLDLSDRYCPNCSQANSTKNLTVKDFFEEFFGSLIDYDSRLFRTVSALLLRPGRISLDYVYGKRITYTNPFRFLLSLAVIYFLVLNLSGDFSDLDRMNFDEKVSATIDGPLNIELEGIDTEDEEALTVLDSIITGDTTRNPMNFLDRINEEKRKKDSALFGNTKAYFAASKGGFFQRVQRKTDAFFNLMARDTLYSFEEAAEKYELETTGENRLSFNLSSSLKRAMRQPGSFFSDLINKLPFATFFFLPVFAVFVWLVYIRKNYTYTDNLVFSFHNQSLFFILLILNFLIDSLFKIDTSWIFLLIFAVYLYKSMRNFYQQGRFKTILKYLFLNTVFIILAWVAALLLLLVSAFTY